MDIAEHKRREEEYHSVLQASIDGFGIADSSGRILDVNTALCRMLGYSRDELVQLHVSDIVAEKSAAEIAVRARQIRSAGSAQFQGRHRRKDGRVIDVEVSAAFVAALGDRYFVFLRDVTEQTLAKDALERESRRSRLFLRSASDGVHILDANGEVLEVSDSFCRMLGYSREELIGANVSLWDAQWSPQELKQVVVDQLEREGQSMLETRHRHRDGSLRDVEVTGRRLELDGKRVLFNSARDITERKRAENALKSSEDKFRKAFSVNPDSININRLGDGLYVSINRGFTQIMGYTEDEIIGRTSIEFNVWDDPQDRARLVEGLRKDGAVANLEARFRAKDGSIRQGLMSAALIEIEGVPHIISITRDMSERKEADEARARLEAQLRQSQKMEALGTLAGGVAHDFNNIIAAIMGNAELARQDLGPGHAALESLEEIRKASYRAKELVQQILAFGRRQKAAREVISLAPVVHESVRLLRTTLPAGVSLTVECEPDAPTVLADATQVEQVLLNLCSNAWHALQTQSRPGLVEIRLAARERAAGPAQNTGVAFASGEILPGRYACLTVRDNGSGMDNETLERMFEPFFTTKPVDKGTGLGLAVVHGIVQEHGGRIEVQSVPGEGSTFCLCFPAAQASAEIDRTRAPGLAPAHGQGRRVLFVDDDESIVFLMTRLLERQGYRVSGFTDARAALAAARADPAQFDLAVTDYNMPGMSGLEVARALRGIRADLPIAVASGYVTEELRTQAPAAGASELIYKPNTVDELCHAVARLAQGLSA